VCGDLIRTTLLHPREKPSQWSAYASDVIAVCFAYGAVIGWSILTGSVVGSSSP